MRRAVHEEATPPISNPGATFETRCLLRQRLQQRGLSGVRSATNSRAKYEPGITGLPNITLNSFLAEVLFLGEKMLSCEVRVKNPFGSEYAAKLIMRFCGQDCLEKPWN